MDKFLSFIVPAGLHVLYCVGGAFFIADAIRSFNQKKYFSFGIDVMLAVLEVFFLARAVFTW